MSCDLRYSPAALEDLDHIWYGVCEASGSFDTADRYLDDLRDKIRKKKKYPKTGNPLLYMGEFTGIYMVPFKAYIAFYRIRGNVMEVGRVLYSKSDYMKTLFGRSEYILEDDED